ncbi:MAG TPA: N-acetyltransferase [archaeon]|nr:N-acetyltransferase [archaeon]
MAEIKETVKVYGKSKICEGVRIMDYSIIGMESRKKTGNGSVIGKNCTIRNHNCIYEDAEIGEGFQSGGLTQIREGVRIGDFSKVGTLSVIESGARIGNHVNIQGHCNIGEGTVLEDGVFVGAMVTMVTDSRMDGNVRSCVVETGARIGSNSTIVGGVKIGAGSIIGANSVVTSDIPPFVVACGMPARPVKKVTEEDVREFQRNILKDKVDLVNIFRKTQ